MEKLKKNSKDNITERKENEGYMLNGNYIGNKGPFFGTRHVQILLLAFCIVVGISTRASMAVQIVAMTAKNSSSPNRNIPIYKDWEHSNIVLSAFYWLYICANLFSPILEKKYGPKWFILGAMSLNSVSFILIPVIAKKFGEIGVLLCRLFQGLGGGFMFPTQQLILGLWAPSEERSRAVITVNTGSTIGSMLASILPGILATTWWGWPSSFYILGAIGLTWCLLYLFLGQNSPATHPRITSNEKRYIQMSLNQLEEIELPIPYRQIFTSANIWAVLIAQIGIAWSNNMATTEYNSYLDGAMHFDIQSNGVYSAIPPAIALLMGFLLGHVSDYVVIHNYVSTVNARRIFHMAGGLGISISVLMLSFLVESQKALAILLMTVVYVSQSSMACGSCLNMIDLSPRFAGIIFGISNAVGQSIAMFAPILVQFIVTDTNNLKEWRIVFGITAVIITGTSLFFVIFASGERQKWDGLENEPPIPEKRKKISVISMT